MTYTNEQLSQKARELALQHVTTLPRTRPAYIEQHFKKDIESLRDFVLSLQTVHAGCTQPAEQWLLDNAEFVEEQAQEVRALLLQDALGRMPRLRGNGLLRIQSMMEDYLTHVEGILSEETILAYIQAYQEVSALTLTEAHSVPLILRVVLVKKLAETMAFVRERREVCIDVGRILSLIEPAALSPETVHLQVEKAGLTIPLPGPWIVHLISHLREWSGDTASVREWLICSYENGAEDLDRIVSYEHQLQAAYQVRGGSVITSLRKNERWDWNDLFEQISLPDRTLRLEYTGVYPLLDAYSRNQILAEVERLARRLRVPENLVAGQAAALAREAAERAEAARVGSGSLGAAAETGSASGEPPVTARGAGSLPADLPAADTGESLRQPQTPATAAASPQSDVLILHENGEVTAPLAAGDRTRQQFPSYYLFESEGVQKLIASLRKCSSPRTMPENAITKRRTGTYFASMLGLFAVLWLIAAVWIGSGYGLSALAWAAVLAALLLPVSEWGMTWLHFAIERICRPRPLLRYDFSAGVPAEAGTMVVIPAIWSSPDEVAELADRLEVHYLANRDSNIHYALLGDFTDASEETLPEDDRLVRLAGDKIRALNAKYSMAGGTTFHFYQRRRLWNPREGVYMGWERKRGKLVEFVELLKGSGETSYAVKLGDASVLPRIRYLITLDADTQLPMGSAQRMIGTLHLPYNRPRLNKARTRVVEGYGVLQPRIGISHDSAMRSRLAYFWSEPGMDPYAFAASDPYQDALGQGIFTGKGIFDVDVFAELLCERIPDNTVLSHDLLEGGFMRAALLSDIELIDDHPAKFVSYQKRLHRWVRGDWQLVCWLFSRICDRRGVLRPIDLSFLTRWQMLDNLRRSLLPPAVFVLLVLAWTVLPGSPWRWAAVLLATMFLPLLRQLFMLHRIYRQPKRLLATALHVVIQIWTLPFQTAVLLDAIGRTLYRVFVSKRRLLEWTSSSHIERSSREQRRTPLLQAGWGYVLILVFALASAVQASASLLWAGLALSLFWALAPLAVSWLDRPVEREEAPLGAEEQEKLRMLARQIWSFYEDYAGPKDHYLPPDNIQVDPPNGVAHRTSPTNIGFLLTSALAAREFGFIDTPSLVEKLENTIGTVENLEKWHGHLYNWYDTLTLGVLPPAYVSTVDSGNFVASLMTVKQGLASRLRQEGETQGRFTGISPAEAGAYGVEFAVDLDQTPRGESALNGIDGKAGKGREDGKNGIDGRGQKGQNLGNGGYRPAVLTAEGSRLEQADREDPSNLPDWLIRGQQLVQRLEALIGATDFTQLYDHKAKLFVLGYHGATGERDSILYDLLASEARQTSFVAIALGQVSVSHWMALGRTVKLQGNKTTLISWSGTMFEYMMPWLIMRTYRNTLWDSTYRGVVKRQMEYAHERGVPFGISESGYYAFDYQMNYQYRAFGVPGLGFKRGLEEDLVIAPYAAVMALPFALREGLEDLNRMEELGARGKYGFYEAIDFTADRMPQGEDCKIIRSFMAHHQGMSLLTIANLLLPVKMYDYFHSDKRVQAAELLLIERIPPRESMLTRELTGKSRIQKPAAERAYSTPENIGADTPVPEVGVHSNGTFTTAVTNSGSGFIRWNGLAVSRWREDPVGDPWGVYLYIRDVTREKVWSPTFQPCRVPSDSQSVRFSQERTTFRREDDGIQTVLEITVSPEMNAEVRRLTLENKNREARIVEVTTFLEIALALPDADKAHPAFTKLFVETQFEDETGCLLARKRPRNAGEKSIWAFHNLSAFGAVLGPAEFETDRAAFIGRGHSLARPKGLASRLEGTVGSVADPAFVMRRRISLKPGESVRLCAVTGIADSKEQSLNMVRQLFQAQQVDRTFRLAWTRSQIDLQHLHITPAEAAVYRALAGRVLYRGPFKPEQAESIAANSKGQQGLWAYGISGDRPIVLARVADSADLPFVQKLLGGFEYLRRHGLFFDLVLFNESPGGYQQELRDALVRLSEQAAGNAGAAGQGGIHVVPASAMPEEDHTLLLAAARVVLRADGPSLRAQLKIWPRKDAYDVPLPVTAGEAPAPFRPDASAVFGAAGDTGGATDTAAGISAVPGTAEDATAATDIATGTTAAYDTTAPAQAKDTTAAQVTGTGQDFPGSLFFNGWGGFSPDGREYRITLKNGEHLPAPWINVMANPRFGCLASELYTGYTWWGNSRECKLTPWSNDPALDPPGEVFYIREEQNGDFWQMAPSRRQDDPSVYRVAHGRGYSRYEHESRGIRQEMTVFVPLEDPVKIIEVKLRNTTSHSKSLSATYYAEWVLGVQREGNASFIMTDWDDEADSLIARNVYQENFRNATAFLTVHAGESSLSWTGDRLEFIGRNRTIEDPAAMRRLDLSGVTGPVYDGCGAVRTKFELEPGAERTVYILLGCGDSREEAVRIARKYRKPDACTAAYEAVRTFWEDLLGTVTVSTPVPEMDMMLNHWLLYQTLACRMWARTAFYQAGGAYGFRDQLQDSLALLNSRPDLTRAQILLHASHQYEEGDVQHWWHEETHRGIRTRFSDDLLWLPYAVSRYIDHTEDGSILDDTVPFLTSKPLEADEHERYEETVLSGNSGTIFDHCLRAVDRALKFGEHGLPLIGIGDWNDGMSMIGPEGRGESVWLGWFLGDVLQGMADLCEIRGKQELAERFRSQREKLAAALNESAWDGQWYRRAFTDAGQWLGSIHNAECRIDSIAQSWSVISGMAPDDRARQAMKSFDRELVDRSLSVAHILTPPFDKTDPSPGYIQGYPPGIRENGGQYTHGVIWSIVAWCGLGNGEKALELFQMFNPIMHTKTAAEVRKYVGEPYAMAADVYTEPPHRGHAGWTWYTGASGWMYQAGLEWILGIRRRGAKLYIRPCIPPEWPEFSAVYRFGESEYRITVLNPSRKSSGCTRLTIDGQETDGDFSSGEGPFVPLTDDNRLHEIVVTL
ncbi:GH36-type glycosyl hydrolase domain-containing protein [Paenibacillus chitinolyticus]|uniref:GH36-type glycosyl hydrolase domain-containing protein n=1 Tax=Paenibacillus chitinolyticus TaxID=79263 RepID=UPI001C48B179|nr:glucoamylase family protein [Paenibacillus chitinolyticus]MBV6716892.1 glycosyl transferase family 36 [Paenibacillus chitinolyticus]